MNRRPWAGMKGDGLASLLVPRVLGLEERGQGIHSGTMFASQRVRSLSLSAMTVPRREDKEVNGSKMGRKQPIFRMKDV